MDKKIKSPDLQTRLAAHTGKFLETIPVKKFYDQALWIEQDLLPRIEKRSGKDSDDYKYFFDVFRSMTYCITILDRFEYLSRKLQQQNQIVSILQERNLLLEKELLKYTTMEDIYFQDALDHYADAIHKRAADLLNKKQKNDGTEKIDLRQGYVSPKPGEGSNQT